MEETGVNQPVKMNALRTLPRGCQPDIRKNRIPVIFLAAAKLTDSSLSSQSDGITGRCRKGASPYE